MNRLAEPHEASLDCTQLASSIASAIYLSTRAHYVRIYSLRIINDEPLVVVTAQIDGTGVYSSFMLDDQEAAAGAELLEDSPMLLRVVNSHAPVRWQESSSGLYLSCFPIVVQNQVIGLVELKEKHAPYHDEDSTVSSFVALYINYLLMQRRSGCDPVTGLADKQQLLAQLASPRAEVGSTAEDWLARVAIDHLTDIRTLHGQLFGDEIVRTTAVELQQHFASPTRLYSLDRDSFAILLRQHSAQQVRQTLNQFREAFSRTERLNVGSVTLSIGLTPLSASKNASECLTRAEHALRLAQTDGHNRVYCEPD